MNLGRKQYVYWEKAPDHAALKICPTPEAEDRVREAILLHLTPDCKGFKFQLTLPPGKGSGAGRLKTAIPTFLRE